MTTDHPKDSEGGSRVLVCGGRHYQNFRRVFEVLNAQNKHYPISCIINGGCAGADTFAADWAKAGPILCQTFKADWYAHGDAAGPIRNQQMLDEGKPDLVIAFPGGRGTADMLRRARAAGIAVQEVSDE